MKSHILLINHDQSVLRNFSDAFCAPDSPYKCTCAENGDHARQMLKFFIPDYVFLNLDPSVADALDFIGFFRRLTHGKAVKIVVFSNHISYYASLSKAYGAGLCIEPPQDAQQILSALNAIKSGSIMTE